MTERAAVASPTTLVSSGSSRGVESTAAACISDFVLDNVERTPTRDSDDA